MPKSPTFSRYGDWKSQRAFALNGQATRKIDAIVTAAPEGAAGPAARSAASLPGRFTAQPGCSALANGVEEPARNLPGATPADGVEVAPDMLTDRPIAGQRQLQFHTCP